ncbi:unnamed protein product [Leptidea sinapis]|uniref:Uncharacterized protein n=1 Tax=Leptidea sinapis TaxID=189913 RepID=A0A5E4QPE9_9NEOP|nr:unnamed protein product [Leptidea sinapis]
MVKCSAPCAATQYIRKQLKLLFTDILNNFEPHLIDKSGFRTVLAPGAIPTIFNLLQEAIPTVSRGHAVQQSTSTSTAYPQCPQKG